MYVPRCRPSSARVCISDSEGTFWSPLGQPGLCNPLQEGAILEDLQPERSLGLIPYCHAGLFALQHIVAPAIYRDLGQDAEAFVPRGRRVRNSGFTPEIINIPSTEHMGIGASLDEPDRHNKPRDTQS